jgi:hypothetical protein
MSTEGTQEWLKKFNELDNYNTSEAAAIYAKACIASLDSDILLRGFEETWREIATLQGMEDEERTHSSNTSPVENFQYFVEMGLYPQPEILSCIERCFRSYYDAEGSISLDEAFFGVKHTKRSSPAFIKAKEGKFFVFITLWLSNVGKLYSSQEEAAENFLNDPIFGSKYFDDVDTFLRDFRRYREKLIKSKTDTSDKK